MHDEHLSKVVYLNIRFNFQRLPWALSPMTYGNILQCICPFFVFECLLISFSQITDDISVGLLPN